MDVQKEIISFLWSEDLKRYIEETGFCFPEKDLLTIAYRFAPSFDQRLRLLELVARNCPTVCDHARKCIAYQKKCMDHFLSHCSDQIYELKILDNPGDPHDYEERYLCESFEAALEMIDGFYQEYDFAPEKPTVRYTVAKRTILRKGDPFREDACGEAILGAGKLLIAVNEIPNEREYGPCPDSCEDCALPCLGEAEFPNYMPNQAAVQYRLPNGSIHYGICLTMNGVGLESDLYVIPLDSEMMNSREFDTHWGSHWHQHIPYPNVRSVSPEALPETLRENYLAFTAWLEINHPM